jgi:hypothetical protein
MRGRKVGEETSPRREMRGERGMEVMDRKELVWREEQRAATLLQNAMALHVIALVMLSEQ